MAHKQLNHSSHPSVGKRPDHPSHPALGSGGVGEVREPSDHRSGGSSAILRRLALPPAVGIATALAAVTVMTAVAAKSADPAALIPVLAPVATAAASLAAGITAGLCHRQRAAPSAAVCGVVLAALLCLVGLITGQGSAVTWLTRLMPLPLCALGGFFTRPRRRVAGHTGEKRR